MTLKDYFEEKKGTGVLATADSTGKVDAAIYSRPHFMEDGNTRFHHARPPDPPQPAVQPQCHLSLHREGDRATTANGCFSKKCARSRTRSS